MRWLKHAFAVDPTGPVQPTAEQQAAVDAVCRQIVKRHLTTPSLLFLEMSRPLNYVGAQMLHFFGPFLSVLTNRKGHQHFAAFLEHRGAIDYLCRRIEELEAQWARQDAAPPTDFKDETRTDLPDESA